MSNQILEAIEEQNRAFAALRAHNDGRIERMEAKAWNKPLNGGMSSIDHGEPKARRAPTLTAVDRDDPDVKPFNRFFHEGGSGSHESKALDVTIRAEGGYAVPSVIDQAIETVLAQYNPLRKYLKSSHSRRSGIKSL